MLDTEYTTDTFLQDAPPWSKPVLADRAARSIIRKYRDLCGDSGLAKYIIKRERIRCLAESEEAVRRSLRLKLFRTKSKRELAEIELRARHTSYPHQSPITHNENTISVEGMRYMLAVDYANRHTTAPDRSDYMLWQIDGENIYNNMPARRIAGIFHNRLANRT